MKIVLTGSRSGIGASLAESLLKQGHEIHGIARRPQNENASTWGPSFSWTAADLSSWSQAKAAGERLAAVWSHADAVIHCAGSQGEVGPALQVDPEKWSLTVRENLDAAFNTVRAFAPLWQKSPRRAKLMLFSGGGATKARPSFSAYGCAKTALVRLVETLAAEWTSLPVDINAIAPGAILTDMTREVLALGPTVAGQADWEAASKLAAAGASDTSKVFGLVTCLLSEQSDGLTGKLISAPWDDWSSLAGKGSELSASDAYTLRRVTA